MTTTEIVVPQPRLWTIDDPGGCACGMRTQYAGRRIIREPAEAWGMKEFIHHDVNRVSLTERTRRVFRKDYFLGAQHNGDSRRSYKGYPDWHLWPLDVDQHGDGAGLTSVWIELKVMRAQASHDPSAEQVELMDQLGRLDPVYLVRPCCLLGGTLDLLLCRHFGGEPRSRYAAGDPGTSFLAELSAAENRHARQAAAARAELLAPVSRPPRAEPELPGEPGLPDRPGPATAVVIPPHGGNDAIAEVEAWIRAIGFPPVRTRYPLRFVLGEGCAAVEVATELARAGVVPPGQWRWTLSRYHFPLRLAAQLGMFVSNQPTIAAAAAVAQAHTPRGTT